jgi:hypothetical protein
MVGIGLLEDSDLLHHFFCSQSLGLGFRVFDRYLVDL